MRQRPHTVAAAPYRPYCPDETTRMLRQALADVEQTAVLSAVPAEGPSALRLPPHDTVTVPGLWRPPVSDNAPSTTAWDDPPIALAPIQTRLWALSSCHVDEPWFREDADVARDRSLRAFHARWSDAQARQVVLNAASPRTLVFSTAGFAAFDGPTRSA